MRELHFNCKIISAGNVAGYNKTSSTKYNLQADKYLFCRVRAVSASEPNQNFDAFDYNGLKQNAYTFIGNNVYVEHQTTPEYQRGVIVDADFIDVDGSTEGWVELIIAIDKKHKELCEQITNRQITDVSMGCLVSKAKCSVCHHQVDYTGDTYELCDHLNYHRGTKYNGSLVFEWCLDFSFKEISVVAEGADPKAVFLDVDMVQPSKPSNIIPFTVNDGDDSIKDVVYKAASNTKKYKNNPEQGYEKVANLTLDKALEELATVDFNEDELDFLQDVKPTDIVLCIEEEDKKQIEDLYSEFTKCSVLHDGLSVLFLSMAKSYILESLKQLNRCTYIHDPEFVIDTVILADKSDFIL